MFIYQKFSISATAHFVPSEFPQLEASIQQVIKQLAEEPVIKVDMVLSFVKDHSINSTQVKANPGLAGLISTKSLPLQLMEALFEAGRNNRVFMQELEEYIRSRFATTDPNKNVDHFALPS
jgi:hypothetical protein